MSMQNREQRETFKWMSLERKINVEIPEEVELQIKYLCEKIDKVEWSGVLFYDTVGSIKDKKKFGVVLKYVFPMDKGTGGSTEYDFGDPDFIDFRMTHPDLAMCEIGHIHSHNNMGAYFSGTDREEIEDNVVNHNMYLSIVVNNRGDRVGKLAFLGEQKKTIPYDCKGIDGEDWTINLKINDRILFNADCDFGDKKLSDISDEYKKYVSRIIIKSDKKKEYTPHNNYGYQDRHIPHKKKEESVQKSLFPDANKSMSLGQKILQKTNLEEEKRIEMVEAWIPFFLSFGQLDSESTSVEDVLIDIENRIESLDEYMVQLMDNTENIYLRFFPNQEMSITDALEEVVLELYEYSSMYNCSDRMAIALEFLVAQIQESDDGKK